MLYFWTGFLMNNLSIRILMPAWASCVGHLHKFAFWLNCSIFFIPHWIPFIFGMFVQDNISRTSSQVSMIQSITKAGWLYKGPDSGKENIISFTRVWPDPMEETNCCCYDVTLSTVKPAFTLSPLNKIMNHSNSQFQNYEIWL